MIPQRILLKGFLCYRDEQEVLLDGSSLWMMAGLNGSGKSAIFDAVTFSLFGVHRGGSQQLVELINHDSPGLAVEFDFELDGEAHRIRRTVTRKADGKVASTQQIYRLPALRPPGADTLGSPGLSGMPDAVADTARRKEFDAWVREHIGLTYETFTSSVLLLQGRAEKLLDSTASGRFQVLAGIVDLERYQRLHEKADTCRKELKTELGIRESSLKGLPEVSEEQLAELDRKIESEEGDCKQAQADIERLIDLERQAQRWAELLARRDELERRWQLARTALQEADAIRHDFRRLQELKSVLPYLGAVVQQRAGLRQSELIARKLASEKKQTEEKLIECTHALEQTVQKRDTLRTTLAEDERKQREASRQLQELSGLLSRVGIWERQRELRDRLEKELAAFPAGLEESVKALRTRIDELTAVERVVPLLDRLHQHRAELGQTRDRQRELAARETQLKEEGLQARREADELQAALSTAERERVAADETAFKARALLDESKKLLREFVNLEGAQVCRQCGQPLKPGHFEEEKARRDRAVTEARTHFQKAAKEQETARKSEQAIRDKQGPLNTRLQEARAAYLVCQSELKHIRDDAERHIRECALAFGALPESFRARVASDTAADIAWLNTNYPAEADLVSLREQTRQLDPLRKQSRDAEKLQLQWQETRTKRESARKTMTELEAEMPGDVGAVRRKHLNLKAQETTLSNSIQALRAEEKAAQEEADRRAAARSQFQQKLTEITGKLTTEADKRQLCEEEIERVRNLLPESWQKEVEPADLSHLNQWQDEKEKLVRADTEERARRLEQTSLSLESLRQEREKIVAECECFPEEARISAAEATRQLAESRKALKQRQDAFGQVQKDKAVLESRCEDRKRVEREMLEVQRDYQRYKLLADLLGRERLQRHLVRRAERQVVDHANAVLDRLSGGQLYLRLRGGEDGESADKALELEAYNRTTASTPINVAFLSGSQRFRVAVSLALGLGQYASRQHRPIESVIIDEGFGCLDRQGRQVMIQELQNLRGQLRCILLVSHQEEFADAFADGYHFELDDGATRVKRFQR